MANAILLGAEYINADHKHFKGNSSQLHRELNKGWEIARGSNGSYVLAKPAQAIFVFKNEHGTYRYNMREDILEYLGRQRLSEKAFETFKNKIKTGTISVYIDEYGYYTLK